MNSTNEFEYIIVNKSTNNKEYTESIVKQTIGMALDSENIILNPETVLSGVNYVLNCDKIALYILITKNNIPIANNLLTRDYNIRNDSFSWTIGSLNVEKEYRRLGIFSKYILESDIKYVLSDKNNRKILKLYMDKGNEVAEKAYFKNGFKLNLNQVVYENDILNKENNHNMENYKFLDNVTLATINDYLSIEEFILNELKSPYEYSDNDNSIKDICKELASIKKVLEDSNVNNYEYGRIIIYKENDKIKSMIYVSFEPSDWRSSMVWWVYKIFACYDLKEKLPFLINSICKLFSNYGNCIRFYIKNDINLENCIAIKSHYLLFEKEI